MIESGTVTKIKRGGNVVVSFDRKSACDQCRMCAVSKGGKTVEVILKNTLGVGVGDKVEVTMGSRIKPLIERMREAVNASESR